MLLLGLFLLFSLTRSCDDLPQSPNPTICDDLIEAVNSSDLATIRTLSWLDQANTKHQIFVNIDLMHLAIRLRNEEVMNLLLDTLWIPDFQDKARLAELMITNGVKHQFILRVLGSTSVTHRLLLKVCHSGSIALIRYLGSKLVEQPRPRQLSKWIQSRPTWKFQQLFNSAIAGLNPAAVLDLFHPGAYLGLLPSDQHCAMWNQLLEKVQSDPGALECEARCLFLRSYLTSDRKLDLENAPRVQTLLNAWEFFAAKLTNGNFHLPMDIVGYIVIILLML